MMKCTLSFDRRFIDEHMASDFMATLQRVVEHPEYMNIGPVPLIRQSRAIAQY
jgi:pyruvate/2-oxoglutarate dehydrogenase complex dihydrolipoamide acyltransferase (E2) component